MPAAWLLYTGAAVIVLVPLSMFALALSILVREFVREFTPSPGPVDQKNRLPSMENEQPASDTLPVEPACPVVNLYSWWHWHKGPGQYTAFVVVHRDRHVETNQITHVWILEMGSSSPIRYSMEKFWAGIREKKLHEPLAAKTAHEPVTGVNS